MTAKHGMAHTKFYKTWQAIKNRCFNPNTNNFNRYGGRGITVYPEWIDDFQAFYDYVSKLPHFSEEGYTLDRIDNNGNYEPNNLRFATVKEQARNRRSNVFIEYEGKKVTLAEAAEKSGLSVSALFYRIRAGDPDEKLFRPLVNGNPKLTENDVRKIRELFKSKLYTHKALAEIFNVAPATITNIVNNKTWKNLI